MSKLSTIWTVVWSLLTDRAVWAGTSTSGVSFLGAAHVAAAQQYLALFAALCGGLASLATFVYVCLKIYRLLKNPVAKE